MMSLRRGSLAVLFSFVPTLLSLAVSLPYYDAFTYTNHALGADGTVTETIWNIGNSPSAASPLVTNAAALSYPGLPVTDRPELTLHDQCLVISEADGCAQRAR